MVGDRSARVFISYSASDRAWVEQFTDGLREAGLDTYFDVADIQPGDLWQEQLEAALKSSKAMVIVVSPASVANPSTLFELGAAIGGGKRIIPVTVGDIDPKTVPAILRRYQFLIEKSPKEAGRRVAETLARAA